jgi:hypothetical protein
MWEENIALIVIGLANLFLLITSFVFQVHINSDSARCIESLTRRVRELEEKERQRGSQGGSFN